MIKEISANARVSFKQITKSGDVFYTFEFGQVRTVDENNLEQEKSELWNDVNNEVNNQIIEVKKLYNCK